MGLRLFVDGIAHLCGTARRERRVVVGPPPGGESFQETATRDGDRVGKDVA